MNGRSRQAGTRTASIDATVVSVDSVMLYNALTLCRPIVQGQEATKVDSRHYLKHASDKTNRYSREGEFGQFKSVFSAQEFRGPNEGEGTSQGLSAAESRNSEMQ